MKYIFVSITAGFAYAALLAQVAPGTMTLSNQFYVLMGGMSLGFFALVVAGYQASLTEHDQNQRKKIIQEAALNGIVSIPITIGLTFFLLLLFEGVADWYFQMHTTIFRTWQATLAVGLLCMLFGFGFRTIAKELWAKFGKLNITIGNKGSDK